MKALFNIILLFIIVESGVFAQSQTINLSDYQKKTELMLDIKSNSVPSNFFKDNQDIFNLSDETQMVLLNENERAYQQNHLKYQERYKGLNVFGGIYILHLYNGFVEQANGRIYPNINLDNSPKINELDIQNYAYKAFVGERKKKSELNDEKPKLNFEKIELILIDPIFPRYSGKLELAYSVIVSQNSLDKKQVMIQANNGRILWKQSLICHFDVPSKGKTKYYGTQNIITDSIAPNEFVLRDNSRNITTFQDVNSTNQMYKNNSKNWDLTNDKLDEVALDAHYTTSRFYDMMLEKFNYKGLDGNGKEMNPVVHVNNGNDFLNAFWDGKNAYFGNGDCHHNPLTTFSIVGHEFTHGVTEYNSNLIYDSESGAINEALSDIFGKACEFLYDTQNFNWLLESKISTNQYSRIFRSMKDPNLLNMPKTYLGLFWKNNADVHINSSVFNYWFYLMVEGGKGKSEFGENFDIQAIPMLDVLKVVFDCQVNYLTPSSEYPNLVEYSKLSCEKLFGKTSKQYTSLLEAWKAVGLSKITPTKKDFKDIALIIDDSDITYCGSNHKYKENGYILNNGNVPINIGETVYLDLYIDGENHVNSYIINKILMPGDTFNLKLPVIDLNYPTGSYFVDWEMQLTGDSTFLNNSVYKSIIIGTPIKNTIKLLYASTNFLNCNNSFTTSGQAIYFSCDTLKVGTPIYIDHTLNGELIKTTTYISQNDITLGSNVYYLDTLIINENQGEMTSTIRGSNHANYTALSDIFYPIINNLVNIDFTTINYAEYFYYDNFQNPILKIGSNNCFATSGLPNYFSNSIPCLDDSRNINMANNNLKTCLNLSNLGKTKLSFDVSQYRADSLKYPEIWDKTSILGVSLDNGTNVISKIIKSQKEGEWVHHEIELPLNYQGKLSFFFYNNLGPSTFDVTKEILAFDAILLDNVKIEKSTGTVDLIDNDIAIFPNPSQDIINLTCNPSQVFEGKAYTIDGMLVQNWSELRNGAILDVSKLPSGMYMLKLKEGNTTIKAKRFVKL